MKKNNHCIDCKKETKGFGIRCGSCEAKRKHRIGILNSKGINHPMFGKINLAVIGDKNPNWNNGISKQKCYCIDCKKELPEKAIFKHTKRCLDCSRKFRIGKNHPMYGIHRYGDEAPNWQGGKSFEEYPREFTEELRESIRKRDNYTCQNCSMTEEEYLIVNGRVLDVHHIDYNKQNCKENNLITLCMNCNIRANFNRKYWIIFYQNKILVQIKENND